MHGMHCETMSGTRMKEPICGSSDEPCHNNSDLRVSLRKLIESHGVDTVKRVLSSIEAANPVATRRSPGRPVGPAIDDWPSLKKAAAIWRQQGGGPVWPPLIAVGESLPGESESNARRLLTRLQTPGRAWRDQFERAGIRDFQRAAWNRKIKRAAFRAGSRYVVALFTLVCLCVHNPDFYTDPQWTDILDILRRNHSPLTVEDIVILIQESPAAKTIPFHLIRYDSIYYLCFGSLDFDELENPPTLVEETLTIDELVIVMGQDCSIKVDIAQGWSAAKTVPFYVFSFGSVDYLVPMRLAPLDAASS
jgi:hypothetical protein